MKSRKLEDKTEVRKAIQKSFKDFGTSVNCPECKKHKQWLGHNENDGSYKVTYSPKQSPDSLVNKEEDFRFN